MHDIQPPITNDEEYAGYKQGLARIDGACIEREQRLFEARNDPDRLENARAALYHIYRRRQGIIDALAAYEQQKARQITSS